jgi:hypothetical protein
MLNGGRLRRLKKTTSEEKLRDHMRTLGKRSAEARRAKRAAELVPRADWPLGDALPQTMEDWSALGAHASRALWTGALPAPVAKELSSLCRAQLALFKGGATAERVDEYAELVATIEQRGSAKQQQKIRDLERDLAAARATEPSAPGNGRAAQLARIAATKPPGEED